MAKVMVSLPDDLLLELDAEAARRGTTRSGLLRLFADESLRRRDEQLAARVEAIMGEGVPHGGDVVAALKRGRPGP